MKYKKILLFAFSSLLLSACSSDNSSGADETDKKTELKEFSNSLLDLTSDQRTVDEGYWKNALSNVWEGIKKRNIEPYGTGLIHRPKSEKPGDAVSEGVGYGMLTALFANDQKTFNSIWEAGNTYMWSSCFYNWQVSKTGSVLGRGAATDAEEDVALALVFADKLVKAGKWKDYSSEERGSYLDHAKRIMNCMWSTKQITSWGTVAPGAGWGGEDFVNPGYFSPAWYKIFAQYDSSHNWLQVVDRSYEILGNSVGYSYGLIPDWMTPSGGNAGAGLGYNAYGGGPY